jgi:hypothetical protein
VVPVGFGYRGFDSSSITAVIPKHEIIRPTEVNRIKKIHSQNWNSSPKIPTGKAAVIKPLPGTKKTLDQLKPKPFRARPVPRSHYNEPYRPELPSKKDRQSKTKVVDPILHPTVKANEDTGIAQEKPVGKEITAELPLSPEAGQTPLDDDAPEREKVDVIPESAQHPGLVSRVWHSVVDPILHPNKPNDEKTNGEETKVDEDSIELNVDPPKVDEMITPAIAQTQPAESDEIPAETDDGASVDVESSALIPESVIETPVLNKDVTGTRKKKRRHEKRRYSDSYLAKLVEEFTENKEPEKHEEPIARPGLLKRAVFGIGSTALGAGKSLISGAKYVVGMGRTKEPEVAQEPDKKETVVRKKKSHRRRAGGKE